MRWIARALGAAFTQLLTFAAVLTMAATPAVAGVGEEMNNYFNSAGSASNVSGPSAYDGQSAGYYSGGSLWTRFPSKTVNPANLQLPSARGGCGGIDLFAGSFSFINADEMVALLKATANNAIGFAFQLAIDSISAEIGGVMKDMSQRVQQLNQFNMNSCQEAQAAIGAVWPKQDVASSVICQNVGQDEGLFSDRARARHGCDNGGERNAVLNTNRPATDLVNDKNYTWYALMSNTRTKPDREYAEFLMTMVGTVIYDKDHGGKSAGSYTFIPPASWDTYTALLDGSPASPTQILRCDTTEIDGCLSPSAVNLNIPTNQSFRARVLAIMRSMQGKIKTNQPLTGSEISLLGMSSIPLYKILVVNHASSFGLSNTDIGELSEVVAIDVLVNQIERMLDDIGRAQVGVQHLDMAEMQDWRDQVGKVKDALSRKSQDLGMKLSNTYRIVERAQMLESTLKNAMSPQMSASLRFGRGLSAQGIR